MPPEWIQQKNLYDTIKEIVNRNPNQDLTKNQISEKHKIRHGTLNLLPTDFCYNLVNVAPDFETKYLIRKERGIFKFVGFHWPAKDIQEIITWTPIGKDMVVTKSKNNILYELDNIPIFDIYKKYLGEDVIKDFPKSSLEFPLIIKKENLYVLSLAFSA